MAPVTSLDDWDKIVHEMLHCAEPMGDYVEVSQDTESGWGYCTVWMWGVVGKHPKVTTLAGQFRCYNVVLFEWLVF